MVDNIDKIIPMLLFESDDDFYYIQILQRKKENPQLGSNSRVIKNYYINSKDGLRKRYDEIKQLCQLFNARASIRLNKRSYEKTAFKSMVNVANSMGNKEYSFIKKSYDRAVGQGHNDSRKLWILDIDNLTGEDDDYIANYLDEVKNVVLNSRGRDAEYRTLVFLPSKTGYHIITNGFDLRFFREVYPEIEIHKDNPTNLYIS